MEITDKLYKKLFTHALFICWNDKDLAASAVNSFLLSPSYSGSSEADYWAYATTIFYNKRIDDHRKKKVDVLLMGDWMSEFGQHALEFAQEETESISEQISQINASNEEIELLLAYYAKEKKTPDERLKAHRLIKKIKKRTNGKK